MSLFFPDKIFHRITDISPEFLHDLGINGLMLDVDNTLSTHGGQKPLEGLAEWLSGIQKSGIKLIILSNAKKRRVEPFAGKMGLPFIHLGLKPLPSGYLRAVRALGLKRGNTAIVGDQIFTDVLGGRLSGVKTLLVRPMLLEDKFSFKVRRKLENKILSKHGFKD